MPQKSRWVGRVLRGKWRIDARIASGGVGTVFAATHRNNGSRVAIKILHPDLSRDADARSRFLQEGYAANQVNHPGVVRILDDDVTEEGLAYLVMELLEGELLEDRRERKGGTLPLAEVYEWTDQLLDVLATAHDKGIVHRDVKPENIFLTKEGRLTVLDFGLAQMKSGLRTENTATGFLLGTPGFMAPEQATGDRPLIDAQTDLWAVGATMFLLLTGQTVHEVESAASLLVAAANFPARPLGSVAPSLPPKLQHVVDRALAFDKRDRWPDARTMQRALRDVPERRAPAAPIRRSIPDDGPLSWADGPLEEDVAELDVDALLAVSDLGHPADEDEPTVALEAPSEPVARRSRPDPLPLGHPPMGAASSPGSRPSLPHPPPSSGALPAPPPSSRSDLRRRAGRGSRVIAFLGVAFAAIAIVAFTALLIVLGAD